MWRQEVNTFVGRLSATTSMVRVRCGDHSLATIGCVSVEGRGWKGEQSDFEPVESDVEDLAETICAMLIDGGFESEYRKARLHATNNQGKHTGTKTLSVSKGRAQEVSGSEKAVEQLTHGLLAMAAEMRKSFSVVCETLRYEHERAQVSEMAALESRVDAIDADARVNMLEFLLEGETEIPDDPLKTEAAKLLGQVASHLTGGNGMAPNAETIKKWATSNPDWLKSIIEDPDIAVAIFEALQSDDKNPENTPPGTDKEHPEM